MIEVTLTFENRNDLSQFANCIRDYRDSLRILYPADYRGEDFWYVRRTQFIDNILTPLFNKVCEEFGAIHVPFIKD